MTTSEATRTTGAHRFRAPFSGGVNVVAGNICVFWRGPIRMLGRSAFDGSPIRRAGLVDHAISSWEAC